MFVWQLTRVNGGAMLVMSRLTNWEQWGCWRWPSSHVSLLRHDDVRLELGEPSSLTLGRPPRTESQNCSPVATVFFLKQGHPQMLGSLKSKSPQGGPTQFWDTQAEGKGVEPRPRWGVCKATTELILLAAVAGEAAALRGALQVATCQAAFSLAKFI